MLLSIQWFMTSTALLSFLIDKVLLKWIFIQHKAILSDVLWWWEWNFGWNIVKYSPFHTLRQNIYFCLSREVQVQRRADRCSTDTVSVLMLCLAKWHLFILLVTNSCSSNYSESDHTNTWKTYTWQMTEHVSSVSHLMTKHSSVSQTGRLHTDTQAPHYQTTVTVAVQGETEESFDWVSDNVQCLRLRSFSITMQHVRSTLAAATSFSLADVHLRTGLPISFIFSGLAWWI